MHRKVILAVVVSLLLVYAPLAPAAAPAVLGKITAKGQARVNGNVIPAEATLVDGDRISTGANTAVAVALQGRDQVFLPEWSTAQVRTAGSQVRVHLEQGALALVTRSAQPTEIAARGVEIAPKTDASNRSAGVIEVAVRGRVLEVFARKGAAVVRAADRTVEVPEGSKLEASPEAAPTPQELSTIGKVVLAASVGLGVTGFSLGLAAFLRDEPAECSVTGSATPFTITCP